MDRPLYVRRRSRRSDARPALLWFSLTTLLLAGLGIGALLTRALSGDWLELKLESARVRVLEALPQPERPDFVPTPIRLAQVGVIPTIQWNRKTAAPEATETEPAVKVAYVPTEPAAPISAPTQAPAARPTAIALAASSANLASLQPVRDSIFLNGVTQEPQRFNNCGPTTLRMYLSYFKYTQDTQVEIANILKPNKDDRNVGPSELVGYAQSKGFHALYRVNGDLERIKLLVSNGLPVVVETGYDPPRAKQGWMGHYLLVTGYDARGVMVQDSYEGPNQFIAWQDLDSAWRHFNRTYVLVYTDEYAPAVNAILGKDLDDATMYSKAAQRAQDEWNTSPNDAFAAFNLGSSLVGLGEYESAAAAYDQARLLKLPWRMLWYQFGPYEAYYHVGRYDEVIALADATLKPTGDLEESYYYKALALEKLGRMDEARATLQLALKYNSNYVPAATALKELGS